MVQTFLLQAALLPALVAALGLGARWLRWPWVERGGADALALGLAAVAGLVAINGWPAWPALDTLQQLTWLVASATLLATLWGAWRAPAARWSHPGMAVVAGATAVALSATGSLRLGLAAASLAAPLAVLALPVRPPRSPWHAAVLALALLATLLGMGVTRSGLPARAAWLLGLGALGSLLGGRRGAAMALALSGAALAFCDLSGAAI